MFVFFLWKETSGMPMFYRTVDLLPILKALRFKGARKRLEVRILQDLVSQPQPGLRANMLISREIFHDFMEFH